MSTDTIPTSSKSTINNKTYTLPVAHDDKAGIDEFLSIQPSRPVVVVQGLGFVGAVMSLVVANSDSVDYAVIGIDLANSLSYWKIASINEGIFPVISSDPKVEIFYQKTRQKQNFYASYDSYAYSKADVIVVDINLDVKKVSSAEMELENYDVSLDNFRKGIEAIARHCKEEVLILVETTVPPGTCAKFVKPIIDQIFTERGLPLNYKLGHSYERVMPGAKYIDSIQNFYRVFSGIDETSAKAVKEFLKTIIRTDEYPLTQLANTTSTEMAKVLENSYRAMNIAFMQEWAEMAENADVNIYDVISAIRMRPTHNNLMWPGLGVGGYCLTKDPLLASWANQNFFDGKPLKQSETAVKINDKMPAHTFNVIKSMVANLTGKKILFLGVSYLNDVGDTRYSPVELLYTKLKQEGAVITLHDPYISYWEEQLLPVETQLDQVLNDTYDMVLFTTGHSEYKDSGVILNYLINYDNSIIVLDANRVLNTDVISLLNKKHQLKIIGRGDI